MVEGRSRLAVCIHFDSGICFHQRNINDLLGGLLEAISSSDLKELNIIKIVSDQNTVVHLNHIIEHCKDILSNRQYQSKV